MRINHGGGDKRMNTGRIGSGWVQPSKVHLFKKMFTFLSLWHGSDDIARKALGIKCKSLVHKMNNKKLNGKDAAIILNAYNEIKQ